MVFRVLGVLALAPSSPPHNSFPQIFEKSFERMFDLK